MRIAFFGTPEPAVPALGALLAADDVDVAVVIANPDRPSGRGHKLTPPPVKVAAVDAGLDVWQPERPREIIDRLVALRLDACAVVAYGAILPRAVLDVSAHGFVNLHFSLLPRWRGAAPVQHAVLAGDEVTGVSCFVLEEGMDTGPVLNRLEVPLGPDRTAGDLITDLAARGAPLLVEAVRGLVDGTLEPEQQDHDRATLAPKIGPDDARIDWSASAAVIDRAIRAFNPIPGAHTTLRGERLKVHRARPVAGRGPAGQVVRIDDGHPVVACGDGALRLDQVQPAGRPRMAAPDFTNGYQPLDELLGA